MLNRCALISIIALAYIFFMSPLDSYGQILTPPPSNKPQNQAASSQSYAKIISNATQNLISLIISPEREEKSPDNANKKDYKMSTDLWLVRFNGALVVVFFLQFIWIVLQGRWTRATRRAFVMVEGLDIGNITGNPPPPPVGQTTTPAGAWIFQPGLGPISILGIKNFGQTPAYDVVHWGDICIREFPLASDLPTQIAHPLRTKSAIPPNGKTFKSLRLNQPLTDQEVEGLKAGTHAIYIHGNITYRDTFRKKRFTNFRYFYNTFSGVVGLATTMTIAEKGNEAN
jgi:hypothetical protein